MKLARPVACRLLPLLLAVAFPLYAFGQDDDPSLIDRCHIIAIDEVAVPSPEPGILVNIAVEDGDSVDDGQLLAQIDDRQAEMAKRVAEYQYRAAKKQAENPISIKAAIKSREVSKAELDEAEQANVKVQGSFSETDVRRLRLSEERAGLQIDLARFENQVAGAEALARFAQYEQAEAMIERRRITAPFSGMVMERYRHKGDFLNGGDPVVHLVHMDRLRVQGHVDASLFHWRDIVGRPVEVTVMLPGGGEEVVTAKIGFAGSSVQDDGTFRVWADIVNRRQGNSWLIGPGLRATMRLR